MIENKMLKLYTICSFQKWLPWGDDNWTWHDTIAGVCTSEWAAVAAMNAGGERRS